MTKSLVGIEWLAATVAPWTVSPHPNFSTSLVQSHSALALIVERREQDSMTVPGRDDSSINAPTVDGWQTDLVNLVSQSMYVETQTEATEKLWELAASDNLPPGARAAAALFGTVGLCEDERVLLAIERLRRLIEELTEKKRPDSFQSSFRLVIAVLLQQLVARFEDSCQFSEARVTSREVTSWAPQANRTDYEQFEVSRGISWSSVKVQQDIARHMKKNALASRAFLEQLSGDTWVQVVRGRSGWLELRLNLLEMKRDSAQVRDDFERKFDSTSGKKILFREESSEKSFASYLSTELSGHTGRMKSNREERAKLLLLESRDIQFNSEESLRLLRRAKSLAPLQSALKWIRSQGPSSSLRSDALAITERALRDQYATEADLMVLEHASDFLDSNELARALEVCWILPRTERLAGRPDWSVQDRVWKTVARLVPGSGKEQEIASRLLEMLLNESVSETYIRPIVDTLESLDWTLLTGSQKSEWAAWVKSDSEPWLVDAKNVVRVHALGSSREDSEPHPMSMAARIADEGEESVFIEKLDEARQSVLDALHAERAEARSGSYSFGGLSSANVAVALASRFGDLQLWAAAAQYLVDEHVDGSLKDLAFDRIARLPQIVPPVAKDVLSANVDDLLKSAARDRWFGGPSFSVLPSALRAMCSLRLIDEASAMRAILKLLSEGDNGRLEAARSLPFAAKVGSLDWALALMLNLSHDANPQVRAEAGFAIVTTGRVTHTFADLVFERTQELLNEDGVRVPLRVLHGLQQSVDRPESFVRRIRPLLMEISTSGAARVVRGAAQEAIERAQLVD